MKFSNKKGGSVAALKLAGGHVYVAVQHGLNFRGNPEDCKTFLLQCSNLDGEF
jgi:hypothetical protein